MPYQVTYYDDMFSVCRVSTIGGSVWCIYNCTSKKGFGKFIKKQADLCLTRLHIDDVLSVPCSTIGGLVWSISVPVGKYLERSSRKRLIYALPGYTL